MKLLHWSITSSNSWHKYSILLSRAFTVLSYSANPKTLAFSSSSSSSLAPNDTLWKRLLPVVDQKVSVIPILDQWVAEGRTVDQRDLQRTIKQFRKFRRFNHALQISKWMTDLKYPDISPGDAAVQLDLISKVQGLEQAEKYFSNMADSLRVFQVYGALLNCYADAKSLEKAEVLMQKMRELGFAGTLSYNGMLNLYLYLGHYEKIDTLIQEMEEKHISYDKFTYTIVLNSYAAISNIMGIETILQKMEADPFVTMDWNAYASAANGYLMAGATQKASGMLKKCEYLTRLKASGSAYGILMSLYAKMGNKEKVYYVWNLWKKLREVSDMGYVCMICSLAKLDDLDGAAKIYEEWEEEWKAKKRSFNMQVPNSFITAYSKKGLLEQAQSIVNRLIDSGKEPNSGTWKRMALGYFKDSQMEKAVEMLKKAILTCNSGCRPMMVVVVRCVEYLKGKGDLEEAEELLRLLDEKNHISEGPYDENVEYNCSQVSGEPGDDDQTLDIELPEGTELNARLVVELMR